MMMMMTTILSVTKMLLVELEEEEKGKEKEKGKQILSEDDLRILTDRSEAAYARAEKGEEGGAGGEKFRSVETRRDGGDVLLGRVA